VATEDRNAILEIATSLGIPVAEAYRNGVIASYERLLVQASLVMAFPLPETSDSPSEFEP
jgi:hypothetical protein